MTVNGQLAGFLSSLTLVHPRIKNCKRGHRFIVLPEYQGVGIGKTLLNYVAEYYKSQGVEFRFTTSTPAIVYPLKSDNKWMCISYGRVKQLNSKEKSFNKTLSLNRITTAWKYIGEKGATY